MSDQCSKCEDFLKGDEVTLCSGCEMLVQIEQNQLFQRSKDEVKQNGTPQYNHTFNYDY